jgi:hypothetical protein
MLIKLGKRAELMKFLESYELLCERMKQLSGSKAIIAWYKFDIMSCKFCRRCRACVSKSRIACHVCNDSSQLVDALRISLPGNAGTFACIDKKDPLLDELMRIIQIHKELVKSSLPYFDLYSISSDWIAAYYFYNDNIAAGEKDEGKDLLVQKIAVLAGLLIERGFTDMNAYFMQAIRKAAVGLKEMSKMKAICEATLKRPDLFLGWIGNPVNIAYFDESKNLSLVNSFLMSFMEVINQLNKLNKDYDSLTEYFFRIFRRNFTFEAPSSNKDLKPGEMRLVRLRVVVNHGEGIDKSKKRKELPELVVGLVQGSLSLSVSDYYAKLKRFLVRCFDRMLAEHKELFKPAHGDKINTTFMINIKFEEGIYLMQVGDTKAKGYALSSGKTYLWVHRYYESRRLYVVTVRGEYMINCLKHFDENSFINSIIHEITHLSDPMLTQGKSLSSLRYEGIASFSEFALRRAYPNYFVYAPAYVIPALMYKPLESLPEMARLQKQNASVEYALGCFMCFVIYIGMLQVEEKQRFINLNFFDKNDIKDKILDNPKRMEYAKRVLGLLKAMDDQTFFSTYIKYSKLLAEQFTAYKGKLGSIITPEFIESFIANIRAQGKEVPLEKMRKMMQARQAQQVQQKPMPK